jgi:hypothetical protein
MAAALRDSFVLRMQAAKLQLAVRLWPMGERAPIVFDHFRLIAAAFKSVDDSVSLFHRLKDFWVAVGSPLRRGNVRLDEVVEQVIIPMAVCFIRAIDGKAGLFERRDGAVDVWIEIAAKNDVDQNPAHSVFLPAILSLL